MLDMRLDYEGNAEAQVILQNTAAETIQNISNYTKKSNQYSSSFSLSQIATKDFDYDEYMRKLKEKESEMIYNVEFILSQYCKPLHAPMALTKQLRFEDEYDVFNRQVNIQNNQIIYNDKGNFDLMIKKMEFKDFVGFSAEQNLNVLKSRVATQIRAGQCLMNIQAYNILNEKFPVMRDNILLRTSSLSAVIQKKFKDQENLDSVVAIDCNYYTPGNTAAINTQTQFYLAFPQVTGNLESLFFFQPNQVEAMKLVNPTYINNVSLRVKMMSVLFRDLERMHKTGIIHKNIRLQNIFFTVFMPRKKDKSDANIFLSFGDFSLSGIDDYDSRVSKSFYVPDDAKTELGPNLDIFQLGIVFFQILFMIPVEKTPGMSLSKIAKIISPTGYLGQDVNGQKKLIFDQLMEDASVRNFNNLIQYNGTMTPLAAQCSIAIFKKIYDYFNDEVYNSYSNYDIEEQRKFYFFNTEDKYTYDPFKLMEDEDFKGIFMSLFISLYGSVSSCYQNYELNNDILFILREMVNPDPSSRIVPKKAKNYFDNAITYLTENEHENIIYEKFDPTQFAGKNHVSVLRRRAIKRNLIRV